MKYFSEDDIKSVETLATKADGFIFGNNSKDVSDLTEYKLNILSRILLDCQDIIGNIKLMNTIPSIEEDKKEIILPYRYKL